jgi:glycosyltransferase involved in cell wall biosynthesis
MKIFIISKYATPPIYGVGSRLHFLSERFAKYGNDVTLFSSNSNHMSKYPHSSKVINEEILNGYKHIWINTIKYKKNASLLRLLSWFDFDRKLLKFLKTIKEKPTLVIISSLSLTSIRLGLYMKRKFGTKLVFEVRDIYPLFLTESANFPKFHPLVLYFSYLEKIAYKNSDLIVGTMPNLQEHVRKIIRNFKGLVIHSPIGIGTHWDNYSVYVTPNVLSQGKFIVAYSGSISQSNSLETYIETIKYFYKNNNHSIHFLFIGRGDLREKYKKDLRNFSNVSFFDYVPQTKIPALLKKCDLLYFSGDESILWNYGQSLNKLVDYMMAGKVILASYQGYQSMINEAECGEFITINSVEALATKILYYYNLPKKIREEIGMKGYNWIINNFNYDIIAQNYYNYLLNIV